MRSLSQPAQPRLTLTYPYLPLDIHTAVYVLRQEYKPDTVLVIATPGYEWAANDVGLRHHANR